MGSDSIGSFQWSLTPLTKLCRECSPPQAAASRRELANRIRRDGACMVEEALTSFRRTSRAGKATDIDDRLDFVRSEHREQNLE